MGAHAWGAWRGSEATTKQELFHRGLFLLPAASLAGLWSVRRGGDTHDASTPFVVGGVASNQPNKEALYVVGMGFTTALPPGTHSLCVTHT